MIINSIENDAPTTCSVAWEISNKCNYSCWYCPENLHSGTSGWPDFEKTLDFFNILSQKNEYVHISIIGGEPTLWPKLSDFLQNIQENVFVDIVTNGSRTLAWWEKNKFILNRHRVIISFHVNTANENHVFLVANLLKSAGIICYIFLMLDPKHEKRLNKFAEILKNNKINYSFKAIFPNYKGIIMDYTEDQKNAIANNRFVSSETKEFIRPNEIIVNDKIITTPSKLVIDNFNNFFGFSCMIGSKRFYINYSQEIFAGSCKVLKLGTLSNYKLLNKSVICPRKACTCLDDIRTHKWRNT
jgi:MoaA/NifB/PqqE/SkfB family radical SAM enzyme